MASTLVVPVVSLKNVRAHPGADKLDLCDVLGYQMCVPKGAYKTGDAGVYFPVDTLIPDEWATKFGIKNFLRGANKDRVGCVKLRGEPSFGVIAPVQDPSWKEGDNVAEFFGAKKYEPPVKIGVANAAPYDEMVDPLFQKYTDIENGRIFTTILQEDEQVVVTEKVHGRNSRCAVIGTGKIAGSRTTRKIHPTGAYETDYDWMPWSIEGVEAMLVELSQLHSQVILYGEVFGRSVQSLSYGFEKGRFGYRAFDLLINGSYVDDAAFQELCSRFNVPTVPVLYRGPFSLEKITELADGKTTISDVLHFREGCVVKPVVERTDPKIGRVILKFIGTEYQLSKKEGDDTTDV